MFVRGVATLGRPLDGPWQSFMAAEAGPSYDVRPRQERGQPEEPARPVTLAELRARGLTVDTAEEALAVADTALDALAGVELADEDDTALGAGAVAAAGLRNRVDGALLRLLRRFDARGAYRADGAATCASWFRTRVNMNAPEAADLVRAAARLGELPRLTASLDAGAVSLRHGQTVTRHANPDRMAAFQQCEAVLERLARDDDPAALGVAVRRIVDEVDPDGSTPPDDDLPQGPDDPRRGMGLHPTIDGLWDLSGTLDPVVGEELASLLDGLRSPEAADTPPEQRRTFAQRSHDAFAELVHRATALPDLPSVHGRPPHAALLVDALLLAAFLNVLPAEVREQLTETERARPVARLRSGMRLSPAYAMRLLAAATVTIVQAAGPWRPVSVGRRMRTLPPYLRDVLDLLHTRCRGPDCDRCVTWCDGHHIIAWDDGGDTDLNQHIPVCRVHHRLIDQGWTVALDTGTGIVTWTSPDGRVFRNEP